MNTEDAAELTQILRRASEGGADADRAWRIVYPEILRLAKSRRRKWDGDWTLETRAIANELFLKVFADTTTEFRDREHFYSLVARVIRQILINYRRDRRTEKRGSGAPHLGLEVVDSLGIDPRVAERVDDLHEALCRLEQFDARAARVVELKFFVGLGNAEVAEVLGVSRPTVIRDWAAARAWLWKEMAVPESLPERNGDDEP